MSWTRKRDVFAWGVVVAILTLVALFGPSIPDELVPVRNISPSASVLGG